MWYLYLDESEDLGFDFVNKRPSKFFTVCVLAIHGVSENRKLINAVKKTLKRKLNPKNKRKRVVQEMKGRKTTISIKRYFYKQASSVDFGIYVMSLNKRRVYNELADNKSKVYNYIARQVFEHIPFENSEDGIIELIVDKSKGRAEIEDFNSYIRNHIEARVKPTVNINMYHRNSNENKGLQACDAFCWGVFLKNERKNTDWCNVFKEKIKFEDVYLA